MQTLWTSIAWCLSPRLPWGATAIGDLHVLKPPDGARKTFAARPRSLSALALVRVNEIILRAGGD